MYVEAYNMALGLEFFRRVTTPRTHAEAKDLAEAFTHGRPSERCSGRHTATHREAGIDGSSTDE
jgi:hypothetical protein